MRVFHCSECGDCYDAPLPTCRGISCRATVCRNCRNAEQLCVSCVKDAERAATRRIEQARAELLALTMIGFPLFGTPPSGDPR